MELFSKEFNDSLAQGRKQIIRDVLPSEYFQTAYPEYWGNKLHKLTCPVCFKKTLAIDDKKGIIKCFYDKCSLGHGRNVFSFHVKANCINTKSKVEYQNAVQWFGDKFNIKFETPIKPVDLVSVREGYEIITKLQMYVATQNYNHFKSGKHSFGEKPHEVAARLDLSANELNRLMIHPPFSALDGYSLDTWLIHCTRIKIVMGAEFKRMFGDVDLKVIVDKRLEDYHAFKRMGYMKLTSL